MGTTITDPKQRLYEFFWVYYDAKTAKNVQRHPEVAIPILREAIQRGLPKRELLTAYVSALHDAVAAQGSATGKRK